MPQAEEKITKKEFEKRITDLLDIIENQNNRIGKLEGENTKLREEKLDKEKLKDIFGRENFKQNEKGEEEYIGGSASNTAGQKPGEPVDEWESFFTKNKITGSNKKNDWKNSGLDAEDAQEAWDNGWKAPSLIKERMISSYQGETNLDPTIISKDMLDKALSILKDINDPNKKKFKDLELNFKEEERNALDDDKLPAGKKKEDLKNKIIERRKTFFYYLDELSDGGIEKEKIDKALESIKLKGASDGGKRDLKTGDDEGIWKPAPKSQITVEILNQVLGLSPSSPDKVVNLKQFLIDKRGYELDPKVVEAGDLLKDCCEKADFDPANPTFCEKENADNPQKGLLPFPTGAGKTTKMPACLLFEVDKNGNTIGKRNIIIVSPDFPLAKATYDAHASDWLQTYECEYHRSKLGKKIKHGTYKVAFNDLVYYETQTYKKNVKGKKPNETVTWEELPRTKGGEKGISVLDPSWLDIFLVREQCNINNINCEFGDEKVRIDEGKKIAKEKLIPKDETYIMFDESHFAKNGSTTYKELQTRTILLGYNEIKMSATFNGKPFSITLPKGVDRLYMPSLVPKFTVKEDNKEDKEIDLNKIMSEGNTLVFLKEAKLTDEQKKVLEWK